MTELTECFQVSSMFLQWWDFLLYIAENIQLYKYVIILVAQLCLILCHPMDYSLQVPLYMKFSRQEN